MINNVVLVGRLTKDTVVQYSANGKAYSRNSIAVQRNYKNQNGEYETDFVNINFFGNKAEFLSNYAVKGSLIAISGEIQTNNYTDEQGKRVYTTFVVVNNVQLLDNKKESNQQNQIEEQTQNNNFQQVQENQHIPFIANPQQPTNENLFDSDALPF